MNKKTAEEILLKYRNGKASDEEKEWVESWILNGADFGYDLTDLELLQDLRSIRKRLDIDKPKTKRLSWKTIAIAASVVIIASISILLFTKDSNTASKDTLTAQHDIPAGDNIAILTLSDGTKVKLDSTVGGITKEAGIGIINDTNGNLTYVVDAENRTDAELVYNTITTPKGGTYKIMLPDGTKVWLNAASSLRFPLSFAGDSRKVELTGEGYFEVATSKKRFKVLAHNTTVEVLGTHFNVNSYLNEQSTNVTLLEGSVKLINGEATALLKPGEQGEITSGSTSIRIVEDVDTDAIAAWTHGQFKFNNTDLKSIMRQLERWYDIDVDLTTIPNKKFKGTISRDAKLSEVISMIELTSNLNFKIQGRSLTME